MAKDHQTKTEAERIASFKAGRCPSCGRTDTLDGHTGIPAPGVGQVIICSPTYDGCGDAIEIQG